MAEKLTPQQEQAVTNRGGRLLISAAAGSGKTKVLIDRLMTYLTDPNDPANLDDFLMITYTKAAAAELRGKIAKKLSERIAQEPEKTHLQKQMQRLFLAKISTVHGFCSDILREYAYRLDIPADFRVADENECREIRERVLEDLLDRAYESEDAPEFRAFIESQGLGRDDRLVPQIIEKVYDSARCHLNPQGWLRECLELLETGGIQDAGQTIWGKSLMDDLDEYLDSQISVFRQCIRQRYDFHFYLQQIVSRLHKLPQLYGHIRILGIKDIAALPEHPAIGFKIFPALWNFLLVQPELYELYHTFLVRRIDPQIPHIPANGNLRLYPVFLCINVGQIGRLLLAKALSLIIVDLDPAI